MDEKYRWKKFQKLSVDSKRLSKRMKKAETSTVRHARRFVVGRWENIRASRRAIIAWLLIVTCLTVAVALQLMWNKSTYETEAAMRGGTYAEAAVGPIDTLNPLFAASSAERAASKLVFSSLYRYDATGNLQSDLATHVEAEDGGRAYRVTLRSDVEWHDGQVVNAEDVAFTVGLMQNPATRAVQSLRLTWQNVRVEVVDEQSVRFVLPASYAAFPHALTFAVLPKHILGEVEPSVIRESSFSSNPVGTGPFAFRLLQSVNEERGEKIVHLVANSSYYAGEPLLSRFEVHSYRDNESVVGALRRGAVNASGDLGVIGDQSVDSYNYNIINVPIHSGVYALFNTESPLLRDRVVRQALQRGTDVEELREALGDGVPALSLPFLDGQLQGEVPVAPEHDAANAASRLDEAGWRLNGSVRQKDGNDLRLRVVTTKHPQFETAAEILRHQWQELGIEADITVVDSADPNVSFSQTVLEPRDFDVLIYELSIGADLDVYAYWHSSQTEGGYNFSNYRNAVSDDNLLSARDRLVSTDLRHAKYRAFSEQWLSDAPAIGLYQRVMTYAHNRRATSITPEYQLISPNDRYTNVHRWSLQERTVYRTP